MMNITGRNVAFLSTYPPRECGIATFTQDLVNEIKKIKLINFAGVIAINDNKVYEYDSDVKYQLQQFVREDYVRLARKLNNSNIDLLVIEHEYGIFGGKWGEYLLDLVDNLNIPFVLTVHTVLSNPDEKQLMILRKLGEKSIRVVTMAKNTIPLLEKIYHIPSCKITVIPHGVPSLPVLPKETLKEKYGFQGRKIISTFGLINPGKGIEYGIEAISIVAQKYKEVLYLILGQTHPNIKREFGEEYRERLQKLVRELGIEKNVKFVDKYLTKKEILEYLKMSDIYMTPYLNKEQAVSGTLAYAAGLGKVIISTPYMYAEEILGEGRGLLANFRDANSLAKHIEYVFENPEKRLQIESAIKKLGNAMMWNNVAYRYVIMILSVLDSRSREEIVI
ncbi:glycosyl transferase group 1 [Thermoanaerobacter mathranii subsp. mathranii str. A3]|jgi:glycosyltransferase involved in cell wall biosynthesis|uniref:Glycosyl transferase group 1 n=1 Tax=Thermoanaerobacter mathranii subsp. mathranii (strain DSM 11426 / CCUG 53645 / CIP 108742 / A3) TaxID=583358 RepID=A0ABM5LMI2_THEM3|nr:glycosyltransferase family 4 protein [Thermoanaerobacter mathranii]ADH59900.1 glycosyl transferase group 1 [Thermoanaerobacter mathranii subsp. mathranii str. A3]